MATIVTKNSSTASAVPTTSDLVQGELAVNVTDKRIFTENASTQIVELGTNPSSITTATATVTGTLTANGTFASSNAVITGGSVNSTPIGATTPSTVRGSTVTATTGFVGGLTGNVTGNLTGNVTGNVTGDLTGNVTGNVTASSGTTTLNDLVVNGTADFTNTKLTNITTPTVGSDAANKSYVDDTVAAVIDSAPAALDTLNELAAALGDDANFAGTVTTALATKLPLAGGTMTGAIAMSTSKITGLGNPTSAQDAATKTYVDTADALKLNLTGGTMSGAIAMGTNKITGVGDPTLAQDAATKAYTDSILGSATSAADSAAAAATSASNAATSASNAATSATASATSATAAAASYDAFDDRYLGDKASDPTLDNDGNALLTGALYFNTTSDVMKVYDGSAWNIAAISSASPTFTGTVTADGLSLGDNDKALFGAGNDLQIYHDGSNSIIYEGGTGDLQLRGNGGSTTIMNGGGTETLANFGNNGAVTLYHDNAQKLATTATGIDVTGTATMDGLTVDASSAELQKSTGSTFIIGTKDTAGSIASPIYTDIKFEGYLDRTNALIRSWDESSSTAFGRLEIQTNDASSLKRRALFDYNGDISFYEDTGTTPKFFWDASAERLGLGTSSPAYLLSLKDSDGADLAFSNSTASPSAGAYLGRIYALDNSDNFFAGINMFYHDADDGEIRFRVKTAGTNTDVMTLVDGNVGIGTTPNWVLQTGNLRGSSTAPSFAGTGDGFAVDVYNEPNPYERHISLAALGAGTAVADMSFYVDSGSAAVQAMTIASSGNVGIGESNPQELLHLTDTTPVFRMEGASRTYQQYVSGTSFFIRDVTAGFNRVTLDSSGSLMVGTTDPDVSFGTSTGSSLQSNGQTHHSSSGASLILNRTASDGIIAQFRRSGITVGTIGVHTASSQNAYIGSGDVGVYFDSTNNRVSPYNVGTSAISNGAIALGGSSSRFTDLYLSGTANVGVGRFTAQNTAHSAATLVLGHEGSSKSQIRSYGIDTGTVGSLEFMVSASDGTGNKSMTLDSSGNLLVGKTSSSFSIAGHSILSSGYVGHTRDGGNPVTINRLTSDGSLVNFEKDGTTVGSIGSTFGTDIHLGTGNTRLRFVDGSNYIRPAISDGGSSDGLIDLATSNHRFKDLYLSGGVYLGGTGAANKLDDYEEGTWTPVISDAVTGGNAGSSTSLLGVYTKVGNIVTVTLRAMNITTTGMTAGNDIAIQGLPFTLNGSFNFIGAITTGEVAFNGQLSVYGSGGNTYAKISDAVSATATDFTTVSDLTSGNADLQAVFTYQIP